MPCAQEPDGVTFCTDSPRSTVPAWDGVPIDVNAGFPNETRFGTGPYPLIMLFHGYGGGKIGLSQQRHWLERGYATFSMTTRGFRESCGSVASRAAAGAACDAGYVRLIDTRYEVRDSQEFAGMLADENLIDPQRIGATGGSYGGGMSMALGALKNRKMLPDSSLVPWTSPGGKPMQIAASAPNIPWTDLAYALTPNGSTLDYVDDAPYSGRVGIVKESFVNGLYISGLGAPGVYAPEGSDPTADLVGWRNRLLAGEPYGPDLQVSLDEITQHHSSYYIDHSTEPAPLLMSSGFTDDLFPANETIRFYNRTRTEYKNADLALFFGDFGHMRAQNKADATTPLEDAVDAWMDFYVLGKGIEPAGGVTAYTETCPQEAPSGGPFTAPNWAKLAKGEIRLRARAAQTIEPTAGDPEIAAKFNPIGGSACATADGADQAGAAAYRRDAAPAGGYTLLGSPTGAAEFTMPGDTSQVAARLLDVAPDGQETLVARGLWRPQTGGPTEQVFQLFPNGWTFAEGHVPKLELLPADTNPGPVGGYGRASNNQQPITVEDLELRLPVVERPGAFKGLVGAMAAKFLPKGYELAADFAKLRNPHPKLKGGDLRVNGTNLLGSLKCPRAFDSCHRVKLVATVPGSARAAKRLKVAKGNLKKVRGGKSRRVKMHLNGRGRALVASGGTVKVSVAISAKELAEPEKQRAKAR